MGRRCYAAASFVAVFAAAASAQFSPPASSIVRERIVGNVLTAAGAPDPEPGDQIGAFFGSTTIGLFELAPGTGVAFEILLFGDDPDTAEVEGPDAGQGVQFRFFDRSSNTTRSDVRVETTEGETFNFTFQGVEVPDLGGFPIPIDLTPTRAFNLRLGAQPATGGEDAPAGDVNADGKIDDKDAALVLRIISGAAFTLSADMIERADVNEDGLVDTVDAIAILQIE